MTPQEIFAKSLVTYDKTSRSNDSFYYHLPYHKDYDLCNWNPMRMYSGNVIKSFLRILMNEMVYGILSY